MEKFYFENVKFDQIFLESAKYYNIFAQAFKWTSISRAYFEKQFHLLIKIELRE